MLEFLFVGGHSDGEFIKVRADHSSPPPEWVTMFGHCYELRRIDSLCIYVSDSMSTSDAFKKIHKAYIKNPIAFFDNSTLCIGGLFDGEAVENPAGGQSLNVRVPLRHNYCLDDSSPVSPIRTVSYTKQELIVGGINEVVRFPLFILDTVTLIQALNLMFHKYSASLTRSEYARL